MDSIYSRTVRICFTFLAASTFLLLQVRFLADDLYNAQEFPLPQIIYTLAALLITIAGTRIYRKHERKIRSFLVHHEKHILAGTMVLYLIAHTVFCRLAYFSTGWDASMILSASWQEAIGNPQMINMRYFSIFPNNLLIVWIFAFLLKISGFLFHTPRLFFLTVVQIIESGIAAFLVYHIVKEETESIPAAFAAYFLSILFFGFSPWHIIPYTDAAAILLPVLVLRMFQISLRKEGMIRYCLWFLTGFLSLVSFRLKPQAFIMAIAGMMTYFFCSLSAEKDRMNFLKASLAFVVGFVSFHLLFQNCMVPSLNIRTDDQMAVSSAHYLMMGLNTSTDGVFADEDYDYSLAFKTKAERNSADLKMAEKRLRSLSFTQLIRHLGRKHLVNWHDGTFGWTGEGQFFAQKTDYAEQPLSMFMTSFISPDQKRYPLFLSFKQLLWTLILMLCPCCMFCRKKSMTYSAAMLSVIGLAMFELLFEARARYLFVFSPVLVILACLGLHALYEKRRS